MTWGATAVVGGSMLGGMLSGNAARDAAETSANAQMQAAKTAADAAKFRPVGITSNFGSSNFQFDPETGYMSGAGYNLNPNLQGVSDTLMGGNAQSMQDAANAQNMGRQYMAQSPQEAAQQWMGQQQALLQPSRDMAQAGLNNSMFNSGTGGLSVAQGGGMGMANPQQQALSNAQALQNLTLAGQAQQQGQNQYTFGQGLLTGAYSPMLANLGAAQSVEQMGQSTMDIGAQLGGRTAAAGANVGASLLKGGMGAATTAQAGNAYSPWGDAVSAAFKNPQMKEGLNSWFNGGQYQPQVAGQYTPGSNTFNGPMPQPTATAPPGYENW